MGKWVVIVIAITALLGSSACGKGADNSGGTSVAVSPSGSASAENGSAGQGGSTGNKEEYLDEATGVYHSVDGISFSVPEGWRVDDSLSVGGGTCAIWPPEGTNTDDTPGVLMILLNTTEDTQAAYDTENEDHGNIYGESHEVTYGDNTYISNVKLTEEGATLFFYVGKSDPVVYLATSVTDSNKAALEEILTSFHY